MHGVANTWLRSVTIQAPRLLVRACRVSHERSLACRAIISASSHETAVSLNETRGVLRLGGPELIPFLQGLLTNDCSKFQAPGAQILYAALLNAKGRHLHDIFLHKHNSDNKGQGDIVLLADVDKDALPTLKRKLLMYKLRSKVDIADVSDEYGVWVDVSSSSSIAEHPSWFADPRLSVLGSRAVLRQDEAPPAESDSFGQKEFKRLRLKHGVAEGDTEIPHEQAIPLEYNLDALNAISYTKGCYVGQELIARTHYKGVVRKRLMPVMFTGGTPEVGQDVLVDGKGIGDIRSVDESLGLVHVRLGPALEAMKSDKGIQLDTAGDAIARVEIPQWWPSDWSQEQSS